jgi:two-component system NtrC family sensor kinase
MPYHPQVIDPMAESNSSDSFAQLAEFTIERAADAVFWIDEEANIHRVNQAACDALGYSKSELESMKVYDVNVDFDVDTWPGYWSRVKRRRKLRFETQHRARSGEILPVEASVNYIEVGGRAFNCAFARYIKDRKRAEENLRASEERFRTLVEASVQGILVHDKDFNVLFVNERAAQMGVFPVPRRCWVVVCSSIPFVRRIARSASSTFFV